jgi:hypothetical protein
MNLGVPVAYSSFPRKRESRDPRTEAVAPCSGHGQALDPAFSRFRGGDGKRIANTRAIFGQTLSYRSTAKVSFAPDRKIE